MTATGKIQITLYESCSDGDFLCMTDPCLHRNRVVLADAVVRTIDHSDLSVFELRIVVPSQHAEDLIAGMVQGNTEIAIGKISPVVEPD